jgi:hypothetical protein
VNTRAHTQTACGREKRVTIGVVCKVAAAAAIVTMISVFSADQMSRVRFAPTVAMDLTHQSELRELLCRIDRRCPDAGIVARLSGRGIQCRIDRRCPTTSESVQAAEIAAR